MKARKRDGNGSLSLRAAASALLAVCLGGCGMNLGMRDGPDATLAFRAPALGGAGAADDPQFAPVQAVLARACVSCHASQVASFPLGADAAANRAQLLGRIRPGEPVGQNWVLLKASGGVSHGGGLALSTVSEDYLTLSAWIEDRAGGE